MRIGGAVVDISCADAGKHFHIENDYRRFFTDEGPDIRISVHYGNLPESDHRDLLFSTGITWDMFEEDEKYVLRVGYKIAGEFVVQRMAVAARDFKSGDIYLGETADGVFPYPWNYPLDELFMINYLSLNEGALIHSCGVERNGGAMVFAGVSGAGKSTLSKLWMKHRNARVLSDDRIIVQKAAGNFMAYGTPWHGDANICSAGSSPVRKLFLIGHGKKNEVRRLKKSEIVSTLLVRSFAPYWSSEGTANTIRVFDELLDQVDAFELKFVPDESAIEFIESL